jgi:hypothetical protein
MTYGTKIHLGYNQDKEEKKALEYANGDIDPFTRFEAGMRVVITGLAIGILFMVCILLRWIWANI